MIRENRTFDEITVGDQAEICRVVNANDLYIFAHASGNLNPMHIPDIDRDGNGQKDEAVAPSMWVGALVSAVLGNVLPGAGTLYRSQSLRFAERAHIGDALTVRIEVVKKEQDGVVRLVTVITRGDGKVVAEGEAEVIAPTKKIRFEDHEVPDIVVNRHQHFDRILEACEGLPPLDTAVACPDDPNSLGGAMLALKEGLIAPIFVGCKKRIGQAAREIGADISAIELIDIEDEQEAAGHAVALVHKGRVKAVMKGHLHTDGLLHHVVKKKGGLRTSRRLSHVFAMDVPGRPTPVLISDAAININPDLEAKVSITQNAIDLARAIGIETPKVGVLSAVEVVNPNIPSTLDAAVLSKMAERGQIKGGLVDGPLAMDNAIDINAARTKGITSLVAGRAEVLIVPNLEAGNMLAKELTFIAHAEAAGLVIGAKVPVILTSRSDDDRARLGSCALALLYAHWRKTGKPLIQLEQPPEPKTDTAKAAE
ncbi:MAG: bifunctional enoyl-CoA hydratase/phosphate acetyltransferase [Pseudomonadota bacterium]